ncbi:MAG TPA: flagellar biosynthetic protein FliO [Methylococcaceae bacterium]|nr:flagellar biosynthetic protein FliO [Methylococcaceae bacterium]
MKFLLSLLGLFPLSLRAAESATSAIGKSVPVIGWGQWLGALSAVVLALLLFAWLLRRFQTLPGVRHGELRVLGGIALGAREKVLLLQTGRKQLVLGVTPGRIDTLCVLEGEDRIQPEPPPVGQSAFATLLRQWTRERSAP